MSIEHRPPTVATVKQLYANAFRCGYPNCRRPLYRVDPETGDRTLNSHVSHICARSKLGPRWDDDQTESENRSVRNLLLLCLEHAFEIDQVGRSSVFKPELLRAWKQAQLEDFDHAGRQGWALTSDMADVALRASAAPIEINNSVLNLGGSGGAAPGAGGGGGGAVGSNARGGRGGPGGAIRYEGVRPSEAMELPPLPRVDNPDPGHSHLLDDIRLPSGFAPGAGGGGAGVVGDDAVGGEGGSGGDHTVAFIGPSEMEALRAEGLEGFKVVIGEGGASGLNPGEHGKAGKDSLFQAIGKDGRILRTIRAQGGVGGRSGISIPSGTREATLADIRNGLLMSALLVAEAFSTSGGLVGMLGGGWEYTQVPQLPIELSWPVLCVFSVGPAVGDVRLACFVVIDDPSGTEISRSPIVMSYDGLRPVAAIPQGLVVRFSAHVAGVWNIKIVSGEFELARMPIEIRMVQAI